MKEKKAGFELKEDIWCWFAVVSAKPAPTPQAAQAETEPLNLKKEETAENKA